MDFATIAPPPRALFNSIFIKNRFITVSSYWTTLCKPCGLSTFRPNAVAISNANSWQITTKQKDFTIELSQFTSMLNFGVNLSFEQPIIERGGL